MMAVKIVSSLSCVSTSFSSPLQSRRSSQVSLPLGLHNCLKIGGEQPSGAKENRCCSLLGKLNSKEWNPKKQFLVFALSNDPIPYSEIRSDDAEEYDHSIDDESSLKFENIKGGGGKPGFISFYNRPYERESEVFPSLSKGNKNNLLWFIGPAVLVSSFIFPSLYMRRIVSTIFEDSLLTDFLILFFTEALFYCGVAVFLFIVDCLRRPIGPDGVKGSRNTAPQLEYRITSVAVLVLSLVIPMVTMGLVWPWTGPAASATLAPYLVGIMVQFAFEQYTKYVKSPSLPVIPVIFQVYRLHQLNRAAQLVTALSFTIRGAEMTSHNLAINGSLATLLNVLQCLGVICIWSLSSFLMRFLPSATIPQGEV